ncbi:MAG: helix-turn-helix transcriptional regulator [Clostridia bacterium]|nr:helix-turn-helix transcriptional regulator [Clostridia bacterium]
MEISKISERIKERRKELDMTQKELAEAMHVSNQLISKWETGESVPTLEYMQQLSEALQTSVQELMGINGEPAVSEPSAPSEPKEKAPSKFKTFWKKNRKSLIISIVSVASALLILAISLLSVFVFVPLANKDKYLDNIDKGIDKYLELGYFNIKQSTETDGEEDRFPELLQGYIDENGNAVYYNSVSGETVQDKVWTKLSADWYQLYQHDYQQPVTIVTVSDLLEEQLKTFYDDGDDFDLDDVKFIRKSGSGYYMEFSDGYFFDQMAPSAKKNIKLTDKIKGRVEMDGNMTKSISVMVKFRNTVSNEKFTVESKIEFLQIKPEIEHKYGYVATANAERTTKTRFLQKFNAVSMDKSASGEFKNALKEGALHFENGSLYTYKGSSFTLFDTDFKVKEQISLPNIIWDATVCGGGIWYTAHNGSSVNLYRYDLETKSEEVQMRGVNDYDYNWINDRYFYASMSEDYNNEGRADIVSLVYDMERQQTILVSRTDYVRYVDDVGRIYCLNRADHSLYGYQNGKKLNGTEVIKEEDGYIYTRDKSSPNVIYQYTAGKYQFNDVNAGVLIKTIKLPHDHSSFNGDYCWIDYKWDWRDRSPIYDTDGNPAISFPNMQLSYADNKNAFYKTVVLSVWDNQWAICYLENTENSNDKYVGLLRLGEKTSLVAYTKEYSLSDVQLYRFGDRTVIALFKDDDLQDIALIPS